MPDRFIIFTHKRENNTKCIPTNYRVVRLHFLNGVDDIIKKKKTTQAAATVTATEDDGDERQRATHNENNTIEYNLFYLRAKIRGENSKGTRMIT